MVIQYWKRSISLALLGGMSFLALAVAVPADAGQFTSPSVPMLRLEVDKPIIHLGESITISGHEFTPGATIAISMHGPESATLGRVYARLKVARNGGFSAHIAVPTYPDAAAREWHTVMVAAASSARTQGVQEGAAVAVQADPMPGVNVVTRARLVRASLVIDGTSVPSVATVKDATHYRISYAGHLRAGLHSAYLKWSDAAGSRGAHMWHFHIGSPYAASVSPSLCLSANVIHLGQVLGVEGHNFTPGAVVTISLGGPNEPPTMWAARALVDATGVFRVRIRIARYPSAATHAAGLITVNSTATGPLVGDLPESVAAQVRATG